ncbi:MAG: hypothetical protein E6L08_04450, partial [Verrucomicrobia bacterium]
ELLRSNGAGQIAKEIRVEWNARLKTCAGRADYRFKVISLNPRLRDHGDAEIDRTLRHELAHLLAQFRAGRRRILPHGVEWRQACYDLGIGDEKRCHNLPFPVSERLRRYLYKCPNCQRDFPRVRRVRRITVENLMRAFDCGSSTKYRSIPLPLMAFSPRNFVWMSCRAESKHLLLLILPCDARITVRDSSTQLGMTKKNA